MDAEQRNMFSFGVSAGLLGVSGAVTWQESWTQGNSAFIDVNGDGFVDYVSSGSGRFGLNTGSSLVPMDWSQVSAVSGGAQGALGDDTYNKTYYLEEPFRAWKAYRSGTVIVDQEASLLRLTSKSAVSLLTDPPDGQPIPAPLRLASPVATASSMGQQYNLTAGDRIYFHMDAGSPMSSDQEASQGTRWNVKIRYSSIRLFEGLRDGGIFQPPLTLDPSSWDYRLGPIYTEQRDRSSITGYRLRGNWQSLGADALATVYTALIDHGFFVSRRVPKDWFITILNAAAGGSPITLSPPQVTTRDGKTYTAYQVTPSQAILEGFIYEPETATFIRTGEAAIPTLDPASATSDRVLTRYLNVLSSAQKESLARVRTVDSVSYTPVQAFEDSSVGYELAGPRKALPALVTEAGAPGNLLPDKGLLLETTYLLSGAPLERLWLRQDAGAQWTTLARESLAPQTMGQVTLEPGAASTTMDQDSIAVTLNDHGVRRTLSFTGKGLVQQLPDLLYTGVVSARILAGQVFSAQAFSVVPAASWNSMTAGSDPQNPTYKALLPCYAQGPGSDYSLGDASTYTIAQLQAALLALQAAASRGGSIFTTFPGDPTAAQRLLLLTPAQMDALTAAVPPSQRERLTACFSQFTSAVDGKTWFFQNPALISIGQDIVLSAMQLYKRDVDLFPYYTYDPSSNVWNIKADVASDQTSAEKVRSIMDACGIQAWTTLDRSIRYTSAQSLPVIAQASLPGDAVEDPIVPTGTLRPAPGEPVGVVMVPGFDFLTGGTIVTPHYFHTFDSSTDFSSQDLVVFPADSNGPLYHGDATMSGGAYGWYYGNWSGYYSWDKSLIGVSSNTADSSSSKPPYSATMSPNRSSDGTAPISTSGRDYPVPVPSSAWIGNVTSYSDVTMNADLSTTTTEYRFAAFISGDEVSIGRNGGDSYYRIPRGSGSGGGSLPFIRSSHASATDMNGGVSFAGVGGSAGRNASTSWQYQGILDLNGDRFPDLVSFTDSNGDSSSFTLVEGNGQGFGKTDTFTLPGGGHLARYDTTSYGFGASMSGSSGGINQSDDSKGRPRTITLLKPEPAASTFGGSVGLNGTFGSSVQSEGFYDMNGDGLPDYVSRSDAEDYSVALNRGDGTFAPPMDWGSGISVLAFPSGLPGDLKNRTDGLSLSGTGSFGANGGLSAGAGGFSVGVSGGFTATVNQTYSTLADVNGDGLADQVVKLKTEPFFRVRYNLGDHFSSETRLYRPAWGFAASGYRDSIQQDLSVLVNGLSGLSIPGGFSIPGLQSLPDQANNPLSAALDPFSLDDDLEYSTGASFNLGANISISISFWLLSLTIAPGINGSVASTSASLKFIDIDGDGLPDHVLKLPMENFLRVKRNLSGTVGLLKKVIAPQGGTYEIGYAKVGNTPDMPQSMWVLSRLTRDDGVPTMVGAPADRGVHSYTETYAYINGFYDRAERMFYGFAEVTATRSNGAVSTTRYFNRNYYTRGMSMGSELAGPDASGRIVLYQQSTVEVQKTLQRSVWKASGQVDIFFPNIASEATRQYQAGSSTFVETTRSYAYDAYGNVVDLYDNGTTGEPAQKVHARITYDLSTPGADYQKQSPSSIRVEDSTGALLRLRQGTYGTSGQLLKLDQYESAVTQRSYTLTYDRYGNLASIVDPRGQTLGWIYDDQVHAYATQIRSFNASMGSPEYDSSLEWDFALGKKTAEVDQNGQRMSYAYDIFGRLIEVRSPYDTGPVPAVSCQYNLSSFPWAAVTFNKLLYDPADTQTMQTVIAMDGLGRVLQTAKQGEQRDSLGARIEGWNSSGAVAYDGNGRVTQEGQPQFASGSALPALAAMSNPTTKSYDAQDRVVQRVLPDDATIRSSYLVGSSGVVLVQRTVDPLGNAEARETDRRGNITKVSRLDGTGRVLMSATYSYDGLSQILSAVDSRGNAVAVAYDLLGRRTSLQSADTGIETRSYDESGNLSQKTTSVLRGKGQAIDYQHDGLNRLTAIIYPEIAAVRYTYGAPGAANNGAGRLVQRVDQSGTVSYQYGKLGETVQMSRSIARLTPLESPVSATFSYLSDYLGRLQQITYPDGEVVSYGYDAGGQVRTVTGLHWGQSTQYVRDIGYDEYGQRTYIEYGNGVRTKYAYDPARRWLASIATQTQYGSVLQAMKYRFDLVGNILGYTNASATYSTSQTYGYDALYQLVGAQGSSSSHPSGFDEWSSTYQQSFSYDEIGNMTAKTSSASTNPARRVGDDLNYALSYSYYAGKGHQAEVVGKLYYRYDANGNTIEEREGGHGTGVVLGGTVSKQGALRMTDRGFGLVLQDQGSPAPSAYTRYYVWDEENRLERTVDGSLTVDYRYGADGQRAVKYSSRGESLYFDSMWQAQTDYPSLRQSKHVYVGSTRVATRLNIQGQLDVGYETVNTYYYHPDHLGSSQLVSDYQGKEYERVEYTPYGESWIEKGSDSRELLPFKFTGKEQDSETGLYYYGARYLNPRTSRWVSADPALGDYLPEAPVDDAARQRNGNLPGMGGVYMPVNLAGYTYAANNPVKYVDPTGLDNFLAIFNKATNTMIATYMPTARDVGASVPKTYSWTATNLVKNEINEQRAAPNVRTMPVDDSEQQYCYPREFPAGTWQMGKSRPGDAVTGSRYVPTNAQQEVPTYGTAVPTPDETGAYQATGTQVDTGYGVHAGPASDTWGCIKLSETDIQNFTQLSDQAIDTGGKSSVTAVGTNQE